MNMKSQCAQTVEHRMIECVAMMMIGDGLLGVVDARRHMELWENGPRFWKAMIHPFAEHTTLTRCIGAAELAAGICLAKSQWSQANGKVA